MSPTRLTKVYDENVNHFRNMKIYNETEMISLKRFMFLLKLVTAQSSSKYNGSHIVQFLWPS